MSNFSCESPVLQLFGASNDVYNIHIEYNLHIVYIIYNVYVQNAYIVDNVYIVYEMCTLWAMHDWRELVQRIEGLQWRHRISFTV